MVNFSTSLVLALSAIAVSAVPLEKRIAQTISASTQKWVAACVRTLYPSPARTH